MALNSTQYSEMLYGIRDLLPGIWQARIKQLPQGAAPVAIVLPFPPGDPRQGMQIYYRTSDIYIMGYRTTANQVYATFNHMAALPGSINLVYPDDYLKLGWDRISQTINKSPCPIKATVAELDAVLTQANYAALKNTQFCTMVTCLSEALRFLDVEKAVRGGDPITTTMVDWAGQLAAGNAVLKAG
jgi:hypothetical protein